MSSIGINGLVNESNRQACFGLFMGVFDNEKMLHFAGAFFMFSVSITNDHGNSG